MQWHSTAGEDRGVSRGVRRESGSKDQAERGEDRQRRGEGGGGEVAIPLLGEPWTTNLNTCSKR